MLALLGAHHIFHVSRVRVNIIRIPCNGLTVQYLISLIELITINMHYFVKLLLHVSAPKNRLHGGHLQGNTFVINSVKDVRMRSYNALLSNKLC